MNIFSLIGWIQQTTQKVVTSALKTTKVVASGPGATTSNLNPAMNATTVSPSFGTTKRMSGASSLATTSSPKAVLNTTTAASNNGKPSSTTPRVGQNVTTHKISSSTTKSTASMKTTLKSNVTSSTSKASATSVKSATTAKVSSTQNTQKS